MADYGPTLNGFVTGGKGGKDGKKEVRSQRCVYRYTDR